MINSTGLSQNSWEKLLLRWSGMEPIGEVKLVCAVIASAIIEEDKSAEEGGRPAFRSGFFSGPHLAWSTLIGIDGRFLMEQISRAQQFFAESAGKDAQ